MLSRGCAQCSMRPGDRLAATHIVSRVRVCDSFSRVFLRGAARRQEKWGLGVEDRERGSRVMRRGEYLDGHVETNMATSSKDRYIPYIN